MNLFHLTDTEKRSYVAPTMLVLRTAPMQMLAASGDAPEVHTTSQKASTTYDALSKENQGYDVWDDDWRQ